MNGTPLKKMSRVAIVVVLLLAASAAALPARYVVVPANKTTGGLGGYAASDAYTNMLLSAAAYSDDPQSCLRSSAVVSNFQVMATATAKCDWYAGLPPFSCPGCDAFQHRPMAGRLIYLPPVVPSFRASNDCFGYTAVSTSAQISVPCLTFIFAQRLSCSTFVCQSRSCSVVPPAWARCSLKSWRR